MTGPTLAELAELVAGEVRGDGACIIRAVAGLDEAGLGDISFLANSKYRQKLSTTRASAVIVAARDADALHTRGLKINGLIVANPHLAFARVAAYLNPVKQHAGGIHPQAVIDPQSRIDPSAWIGACSVIEAGVEIGAHCYIGPGCVIGEDCVIGTDSRLVANVTLCHGVQVGQRVLLHPGVVLGADGFGLANDQGVWVKVPQVGSVIIGDDVEVGANTTIDRGALKDTVIEQGVKLDNLIQIGHNVRIGAHTAIAACTAIAGSASIGRHCAIGGAVGIVGHLEIADNVTITAMSYVTRSIREAGIYSSGSPLEENAKWHRNFVRMKQLDDMARQIKQLEKTLQSLLPKS